MNSAITLLTSLLTVQSPQSSLLLLPCSNCTTIIPLSTTLLSSRALSATNQGEVGWEVIKGVGDTGIEEGIPMHVFVEEMGEEDMSPYSKDR
jgi:hypothetical protein